MNIRKYILGSLAMLVAPAASLAAPAINIGTISLEPNKANQIRAINVTSGDAIQGFDLVLQVADGGPEAAEFGGHIKGPAITAISVIAPNTVFGPNNTGQGGVGMNYPQLWDATTTTGSGSVAASGVIAQVTFDTTGLSSGNFPLLMTGTLLGDSDFANPAIVGQFTNGTISIAAVPEPTSVMVIGVVGLLVVARRRRTACVTA